MPRYFFNIHDGNDLIDRDGTELRDEAQARAEAVHLAGRCIAELETPSEIRRRIGFWR